MNTRARVSILSVILTLALAALSAPCYAQTQATVTAAVEKSIREALKHLPQPVQNIRTTPYAGLLEVSVGGRILYMTPDVRYVFEGSVLDGRTGKDLTEGRDQPFPRFAPADVLAGSVSERIRHLFTTRSYDKVIVLDVVVSAVPGLWEIHVEDGSVFGLYYTNEGVDFILNANLFDVAKRINLTEARVNQLSKIDFGSLPLTDALVHLQGTGSRRMVVFADPLDPYSRRLQQEIAKLKDVTVYFFLVPILGSQSTAKARDILCAASPAEVWRSWIADQRPVPDARLDCSPAGLERNVILAERHRIRASPILVFADSTRVYGWKLHDVLEKHLVAAMQVRN